MSTIWARAAESDVAVTGDLTSTGALNLLANADVEFGTDPVTVTAGSSETITATAGRSVLVNGDVTTNGSNLTLLANAGTGYGITGTARPPGEAVITLATGATINTGAGTLVARIDDGDGLTNGDNGAITLTTVTAGAIDVDNLGTGAESDVAVTGGLTSTGALSLLANADVEFGTNPVTVTAGSNETITATAGRSVLVNGDVTTNGSNLTLLANAGTSYGITGTARPPGEAVITRGHGRDDQHRCGHPRDQDRRRRWPDLQRQGGYHFGGGDGGWAGRAGHGYVHDRDTAGGPARYCATGRGARGSKRFHRGQGLT